MSLNKSDQPILTTDQLKEARRLLAWTQAEIGMTLSMGAASVGQAERTPAKRSLAVARLKSFYEARGVQFLFDGQVQMTGGSSISKAPR